MIQDGVELKEFRQGSREKLEVVKGSHRLNDSGFGVREVLSLSRVKYDWRK